MISQNEVTIIIPHFGAEPQHCRALGLCLNSLKATFSGTILVVKNGQTPCECPRSITLHDLQGQCKAVNAGVEATNTPWILVSNDDMIYSPNWFNDLTTNINHNGHLCISPKLIEPQDGAATFEKFFAGGAGGDFNPLAWERFTQEYALRSDEEKTIRTGFNLPFLMSRELWDIVGGYDINYDPWGSNSDSDLEYCIKLAGVQPMQNQQAIVYHFSQTSGTFEPRNRPYWETNWQYFISKWGFPRTDDGIWQASFKIPTIEEGRIFIPWWEDLYKDEIATFTVESEAK